jgi:chromosome segregation ATPase
MIKELEDNLSAINNEVAKLKKAIEHIETSKKAAQTAVTAAEKMNGALNKHVTDVTEGVQSILKPHQDLIEATERLTETIDGLNIPRQLKLFRIIAIGTFLAVVAGMGAILFFCHR